MIKTLAVRSKVSYVFLAIALVFQNNLGASECTSPILVATQTADIIVRGVLLSSAAGKIATVRTEELINNKKSTADISVITMPYRKVPDNDQAVIVFCRLTSKSVEVFDGFDLANDAEAEYICDLVNVSRQGTGDRLRFFAKHLEASSEIIRHDARRAIMDTRFSVLLKHSSVFDSEELAKRLRNRSITSSVRLAAILLGLSGTPEDGKSLWRMINDRQTQSMDFSGLMAGYLLLNPRDGVGHILSILCDKTQPQEKRLSAGRSILFILSVNNQICREELNLRMEPALDDKDVSWYVVELYRAQHKWSLARRILSLEPNENDRLLRRSLIRYCLECPTGEAKAFVKNQEALFPEYVSQARDALRIEADAIRRFGSIDSEVHRDSAMCVLGTD